MTLKIVLHTGRVRRIALREVTRLAMNKINTIGGGGKAFIAFIHVNIGILKIFVVQDVRSCLMPGAWSKQDTN